MDAYKILKSIMKKKNVHKCDNHAIVDFDFNCRRFSSCC